MKRRQGDKVTKSNIRGFRANGMKPIMNFCRTSILAALACWMCLSAGALAQETATSAPRRSKEFPALKDLAATRISALDSEIADKNIEKVTASDDQKRVIDFAVD